MRQDKLFHEGESFNAKYFAELISPYFDHIVTIDPHLHRIHDLGEVYLTETIALHADQAIMAYLQKNFDSNIYLIGPDQESEQWIAQMAKIMKCPYVIAQKERFGDAEVQIHPFEIDLE